VQLLPDFQAANFRALGALQWGQKTSNELGFRGIRIEFEAI